MSADRVRQFLSQHHHAVLTTFRPDGRPHMSPVILALEHVTGTG